jgi:hypothetical protein
VSSTTKKLATSTDRMGGVTLGGKNKFPIWSERSTPNRPTPCGAVAERDAGTDRSTTASALMGCG